MKKQVNISTDASQWLAAACMDESVVGLHYVVVRHRYGSVFEDADGREYNVSSLHFGYNGSQCDLRKALGERYGSVDDAFLASFCAKGSCTDTVRKVLHTVYSYIFDNNGYHTVLTFDMGDSSMNIFSDGGLNVSMHIPSSVYDLYCLLRYMDIDIDFHVWINEEVL